MTAAYCLAAPLQTRKLRFSKFLKWGKKKNETGFAGGKKWAVKWWTRQTILGCGTFTCCLFAAHPAARALNGVRARHRRYKLSRWWHTFAKRFQPFFFFLNWPAFLVEMSGKAPQNNETPIIIDYKTFFRDIYIFRSPPMAAQVRNWNRFAPFFFLCRERSRSRPTRSVTATP